jgi:hypothetical protein
VVRTTATEFCRNVAGASSAFCCPLFNVGEECGLRKRNWGAAIAGMPSPEHKRGLHVLDNPIDITSAVLFRVLQQFTELAICQSFPDHRHARRWKVPIRGAWRSVLPFDVEILVTDAALHRLEPLSSRAAADVHGVPMAIISLPRKVSARVAVHTPRVTEHRYDRFESGGSGSAITRGGPVDVFAIRWCVTRDCMH